MEPEVDFGFSVGKEFVETSYCQDSTMFHILCSVHINNVDVDC